MSISNGRAMAAILWFLVMVGFQDGWQHVQVKDSPKLTDDWRSFRVSIINGNFPTCLILYSMSCTFMFPFRRGGRILLFLGVADFKDGQQYNSFIQRWPPKILSIWTRIFLSFCFNLTSCGFNLISYDVGSYWLNLTPCRFNLPSFGLNLIQRVTNMKFFSSLIFSVYWSLLATTM